MNQTIPQLVVQLVTYNGARYIPFLCRSLRAQTMKNWQLMIWDNGSTDETVLLLKQELADGNFTNQIEVAQENIGFAGGHNQLFKKHKAPFVLLLNQDMYLNPECIEKMFSFASHHEKAAAVTARLMKWNVSDATLFFHDEVNLETLATTFSDQIDSMGLKVFRNRRVIEWGGGEDWKNFSKENTLFSNDVVEVFGVSGALPLYCRSAVEAVALEEGELFDSSFESYKEDVDLAFRLRQGGFKAFVCSSAVAYHDRTTSGVHASSNLATIINKQSQSARIKFLSYRNHLRLLFQNEYGRNFICDFPWIIWYELKKLVFCLIFDRAVLKSFKELWLHRKDIWNARFLNKSKRKTSYTDLRAWWTHCSQY